MTNFSSVSSKRFSKTGWVIYKSTDRILRHSALLNWEQVCNEARERCLAKSILTADCVAIVAAEMCRFYRQQLIETRRRRH